MTAYLAIIKPARWKVSENHKTPQFKMDYCSWFKGLNANALNGTQNTEFKKTEFLKFKMFEQFYENMIYKNKNHIIWWQALEQAEEIKVVIWFIFEKYQPTKFECYATRL